MDKSKRLFLKSKRFFHRRLPSIQSGDQIDYRNMSLISRFISEEEKKLSKLVNRLTLKQQRLITIAIKKLPYLNNKLFNGSSIYHFIVKYHIVNDWKIF